MSEKDVIVVLADVSGSMEYADKGAQVRRFDLLRQALNSLPKSIKIFVFSDGAYPKQAHEVSLLGGGTALHLAIDQAARCNPIRTIIVSDGEPDSEKLAHVAAERLCGIIDVVYCGDPHNERAKTFLQSLAKGGAGGFYQTGDEVNIEKQLPAVIAGLLTEG